MRELASIDGVITSLDEARIPVLDRGLLYGDAVFEALRTYAGIPHALSEHVARLFRSSAIIGMDPGVTREVIEHEVCEAIRRCDASQHYVRIVLTRGHGPFGLSLRGAGPSLRVILVRALSDPDPRLYRDGLRVETVTVPPSRFVAGAKPSSYLTNLLALEHAQSLGADDAFLLGEYGELLEGATSSVFVVRRGRVETPTLALGILPGITRDLALALASEQGFSVHEGLLTIHDAYRAQEVFVTSSVCEIAPVVAIDGVSIGDGRPGPITTRLMAAYNAVTHASARTA